MLSKIFGVASILGLSNAARNILDYGAVPDLTDTDTAYANAHAMTKAIEDANAGDSDDRTVLVPADNTFYFMPVHVENLYNFQLTIDGTIYASEDYMNWENRTETHAYDFITINDSTNIKIDGTGLVDGQGFKWWMREWAQKNPAHRPCLLQMERVSNCEITGVKWQNAPYYHLNLRDIANFEIHDLEIYVDVWKQQNLLQFYGAWDYSINYPTFPLNTDGIDPAGTNVHIYRVKITNFDDAVAVKPAHGNNKVATCASNILVEDAEVVFGVGMTIGSVPPSSDYACVRDVTFRNIESHYPFKAIYVKTNPGSGSGEIQNILYENMVINFPIWWNIYIGPQQQKQPGGAGPGCMFYPLGGCETQPLIDMDNVVLRNITSTGGLLPPGIIRCNETNPCHGFEFTDVHVDGWWNQGIFRFLRIGYISQNAYGTQSRSHPSPKLLAEDGTVNTNIGGEDDLFEFDMFTFLIESLKFFKARSEQVEQ